MGYLRDDGVSFYREFTVLKRVFSLRFAYSSSTSHLYSLQHILPNFLFSYGVKTLFKFVSQQKLRRYFPPKTDFAFYLTNISLYLRLGKVSHWQLEDMQGSIPGLCGNTCMVYSPGCHHQGLLQGQCAMMVGHVISVTSPKPSLPHPSLDLFLTHH